MKTFLRTVAEHIIEEHRQTMEQLVVVLPSRRAVTYLKREFKNLDINDSIWIPDVFAIEDFVYEASGFHEIDPAALIIELFHIHLEINNDSGTDLENFLGWAPMMVNDFNSLDENLANATELFTFLSEAKALEKWRPNKPELSINEKQYVAFFRSLKTYYHKLREKLLKQRKAYHGMAIRAIHESGLLLNHEKWQHFLFAGFYALTQAEKELITALKKEGKLTQLFDADHYYLQNQYHEAGNFLREKSRANDFQWVFDHYKNKKGEIHINGLPGDIGQARRAGQIIHDLLNKKDNSEQQQEHTAVILADESLLLPMLNSCPEELSSINITMGFPIKSTSVASLVKLLLKVAIDKERYKRESIHVNELLQIINLPVFEQVIDDPVTVRKHLLNSKTVFYHQNEVSELIPARLSQALFVRKNPHELLDKIIDLTSYLGEQTEVKPELKIENYGAALLCDQLIEIRKILLNSKQIIEDSKDLDKLIRKTVLTSSLPFSGEPLKGLQIMGMLESRALDFENVIILSVNEGALPAGKNFNSLIPHDIRQKFNMPTYHDNDSIYAYHFYRLLQRAKNTYLIYNTETGNLGSNEQSRFIKQLKHEMPGYNPSLILSDEILTPPVAIAEDREILIKKSHDVMLLIKDFLHPDHKGISATGLKTLTNCSLQFYFKYLLKLKKAEELEDTIPMNIFGNVVHKILENIFNIIKSENDGIIKSDILKNQNIQKLVLSEFQNYYDAEMLVSGKNKLMTNLAEYLIDQFLKQEIKAAQHKDIKVTGVEEQLRYTTEIQNNKVLFRGIADRIDEIDHKIRIIDYKTGNVNKSALTQSKEFETMEELKSGEIIQVLFYDWIYSKMKKTDDHHEGGIVLLANPKAHSIFFKYKKDYGINSAIRSSFEKIMFMKIEELLDPEVPLKQTDDLEKCEHCDFNTICNRIVK
ncbi:MAG: PD-(D/E)XK nuclease family protein [Bacteroidales bacterium]|nr:PD-(D/E)XK nuclease family protein [Bacteroidales bacterium]